MGICVPSLRRHTRAVLSSEPVTTCLTSEVTHTERRRPTAVPLCAHSTKGHIARQAERSAKRKKAHTHKGGGEEAGTATGEVEEGGQFRKGKKTVGMGT
eukprot:6197157-Pleurochrysis_carterae.AAC.1